MRSVLAEPAKVTFRINGDEETNGLLLVPSEHIRKTGIVIAHGLDNDMTHPLLAAFAEGLSRAGYPTLRFNFPYRTYGRKSADKSEKLIAAWKSAISFLKEQPGLEIVRIIGAGKSLGGLVASRGVAQGGLHVEGLIFLGYPFHSMADKERLRDEHLYAITIPLFFFAGSRDPLCDIDKLRAVLSRLQADWVLEIIEKGDHSFHVPKSTGKSEREVFQGIIERTLSWLKEHESNEA